MNKEEVIEVENDNLRAQREFTSYEYKELNVKEDKAFFIIELKFW